MQNCMEVNLYRLVGVDWGGGRRREGFFKSNKVGGVQGFKLAMVYISTDKALPCRCKEFQLKPFCLCGRRFATKEGNLTFSYGASH